ncbi:TetR/AcrR family transcriptional regulator [Geomicrobium sp. JCM 19055]|uniref:TetR/AcrR family transcriptional regulator n=1 Tax=Geomicrobium sp. JCM 19055 TaxID=1460649 RepID=UPI00045ED4DF|nr:TetR/AcrR family transcriptional regulator [Geomicrobium sp. JCM 19055]GAJ97695.1 transcriptional regulator, TetR family [Geomicrobium sp. JCM 19055]
MRNEEKNTRIFEATTRVINELGINQFTLDKVAERAGVSKGGLLYRFPSKERLLKGWSHYVLALFTTLVEEEEEKSNSFATAYLQATLRSLESAEMKTFMTVSGYQAEEQFYEGWKEFYAQTIVKMQEETSPELASIIQLTCDGLWLQDAFQFESSSRAQAKKLVSYLQKLATSDSGSPK